MSEGMAQRIRQLRHARGLTLEQIADVVGVGKSTVRKWETGMIANMRRDKIADLAKALGTTPAYLMGWDEEKAPTVSGERSVSDDDIKFALFGGSGEITDAMYREVKEFAALVKLREDMKKKE